MLGLNPSDQELIDIPNIYTRNGFIYYADFCQLCLEFFRQEPDEEEEFRRNMFKVWVYLLQLKSTKEYFVKVLCGTEPFPTEFRAKKYKVEKHFLEKVRNETLH